MSDHAPTASRQPAQVGGFQILVPIASGGMATVYLARSRGHGGFERDVALKLTLAHLRDDPNFARELLEEAKLAVRIRHANVVQVLDVGDDPNGMYLVMEYVEGDTLAGFMRRSLATGAPIATSVALRILLDALAGLHAAHELADEEGHPLDLVHRDFSPQNILVGTDGVGRLADFGIAKAASRIGSTQTGLIKGKVKYMSPEQARGERVDRRCDVWAAGVVAWEILAGRALYSKQEADIGLLYRIAHDPPPKLREVAPDVHPALEDAVANALDKDPDARCATAATFSRTLTAALRTASVTLAEAHEVAEVLATLCGEKLAERRARVKEVTKLRGALDRAQDSAAESLTPPSGAFSAASDDTVEALVPPPLASRRPAPEEGTDAPSTHTTAVTTGITQLVPASASRWVVVAGSALVLAAVGVAIVAAGGPARFARGTAHPPPPVAAPEVSPEPPPATARQASEASAPSQAATVTVARPAESAASPSPSWAPGVASRNDKPGALQGAGTNHPQGGAPAKPKASILDQQF